ncbi:MAG: DUF2256 domain-containing protein [Planctomycetaceae bacterium]
MLIVSRGFAKSSSLLALEDHLRKSRCPTRSPTCPTKNCVACGRPFTWRKKWAKVWDEVKYCSEKCRKSGLTRASTS